MPTTLQASPLEGSVRASDRRGPGGSSFVFAARVATDSGVKRLLALLALPLRALVRLYQLVLRPVMPPLCRFYPSCSDYTLEALRVHGAARGSWLAVRRIGKCHPFHPGGVDLVPPAEASAPMDAGADPERDALR
jgi:uncharacterized protein